MKKIFTVLSCAVLLSLCAAPRIAVFDEPGFPNASKRDAEFYRKALGGTVLRLNELSKLKNFDIIVFPHGGYVPAAAETPVYHLMRRGGTVIVCGDLQEPPPPAPEKRQKMQTASLLAFEEKYGMDHGGPLSLVNGRWIVAPSGAIYDRNSGIRWFEFFALFGWPNYAQSYAPNYMREFTSDLMLNPLFKNSGLPQKITPPEQKVRLARLRPQGNQGDQAGV